MVYLATSPDAADVSGRYFVGRRPVALLGQAADDDAAELLWEISETLVGLRPTKYRPETSAASGDVAR